MKKAVFAIVPWVLLLLWVITWGSSDVRRESALIAMPDTVITELGEHMRHKFYDVSNHTTSPDHNEGQIKRHWGLMGGIDELGALTAEQSGTVSFSVSPRKGEMKLLLQDTASQETVYYDYVTEEERTVTLEKGTYRAYLVGNYFSGECTISYQGMVFEDKEE